MLLQDYTSYPACFPQLQFCNCLKICSRININYRDWWTHFSYYFCALHGRALGLKHKLIHRLPPTMELLKFIWLPRIQFLHIQLVKIIMIYGENKILILGRVLILWIEVLIRSGTSNCGMWWFESSSSELWKSLSLYFAMTVPQKTHSVTLLERTHF